MLDKSIFEGMWKLPEHTEYKCFGKLTFDPENNITLNTIGNLCQKKHCRGPHEFDYIHGITMNGEKITLYKSTGRDSYPIPGIPSAYFHSEFIIIGGHLNNIDDLEITSSAIHLTYLDEWVNKNGFNMPFSNSKKIFAKVKYTQPRPIILAKNRIFKISLWFSASFSPGNSEALIKQKVYLNINYYKNQSTNLLDLLEIIYRARNFLTFATSRLVLVSEVSLNHEGRYKGNYKIFFKNPIHKQLDTFVPTFHMLFAYEDVENNIQVIFNNWLQKYDVLLPVFKLYFNVIYSQNVYAENLFLNLVFALETYHRRTNNRTQIDPVEFQILVKMILEKAGENKKWISDKLQYSNELSLRARLKEITSKHEDILKQIEPALSSFLHKVVSTRNYLTHYSESLKAFSMNGKELEESNHTLFLLITICLLDELAFNKKEIEEALHRSTWSVFRITEKRKLQRKELSPEAKKLK